MSVRVDLNGVSKTFPGGVEAVAPLDLGLEPGRTTALVGPSGCGKSTVLRMIAGLESPSTGSIQIDGAPPSEILKTAGLSVAFQDPSLLPWRSVRQNIALACNLARRPRPTRDVDALIELVGLRGFEDTRPAALSGGMRQRAAIARALATDPALLLLDEPFGAVDELTRRQLAQDLPGIWEARGTTTVLVTHSVSEAVLLSDRVIVFSTRPAQVEETFEINLDRPRLRDVTHSDLFLRYVDDIHAALASGMLVEPPKAAQ